MLEFFQQNFWENLNCIYRQLNGYIDNRLRLAWFGIPALHLIRYINLSKEVAQVLQLSYLLHWNNPACLIELLWHLFEINACGLANLGTDTNWYPFPIPCVTPSVTRVQGPCFYDGPCFVFGRFPLLHSPQTMCSSGLVIYLATSSTLRVCHRSAWLLFIEGNWIE